MRTRGIATKKNIHIGTHKNNIKHEEIRETISHEEIIIYGIHLEAKICTKIFTSKKITGYTRFSVEL